MKNYRYDGSRRFNIKGFDCADCGEFSERHEAIREFTENLAQINEYQQKLFAEQKEGIIFVFQAMDAAGKDGAVRAVLSCLSPQGVSEHSFKVPSAEENRHDYLWRFWDAIPEKGSISIFNRSYYEDVLVQKVHKIYEKNKYADRIDLDTMVDKRYEQIRSFEKYLWENSIRVVKIFLCVSKDEQARRFISRIDTPKKNWKFSSGDIDERAHWDEYMDAYETAINRTARKNTPWYVVPADHKWYARLVISRIVLDELRNMDPKWPVLDEDEKAKLAAYREALVAETDPTEEKDDDKAEMPKPSDTAIGIALRDDRRALSEKKFRKLLKKSVFENFSERFGVSAETQEKLGRVYLDCEEAEAIAESDDIAVLKAIHKANKKAIEASLEGCGKEGRKLYGRFKKASHARIDAFKDQTDIAYAAYEEELKQIMTEYELAVGTDEADADEALAAFTEKIAAAFDAHRDEAAKERAEAEIDMADLAVEYAELCKAFMKMSEAKAPAEETDEAQADEAQAEESATEEDPAEAEEATAETTEETETDAE